MENYNNAFLLVSVLAQGFCIYHVIKHRKPWWWILFIIVFPLFGCFWYFLREVRGSSGSTHMKRRMVNLNPEKTPASKRLIADLEHQLEVSDTVDLRIRLAEANLELGNAERAVDYFKSCLKGYHKDDPVVLFGLSKAHSAAGNPEAALGYLDLLDKSGRTDYRNERLLVRAKAHAALNQFDDANRYFEEASNRIPGEEARCLYAQFLAEQGRTEEANQLFDKILRNAELGDRDYRSRNQEWISIAKRGA